MIMKNIRYLFLLLVMTICFMGCEEDLLELPPIDKITTANYYQTPNDFLEASVGIYDAFQTFADRSYLRNTELRSDNVSGRKQADLEDISNDADALSSGTTDALWSRLYKMIFLSNNILDRIDDVVFTDSVQKNTIKGEASFFRGLGHYYVGKFFGEGVVLNGIMHVEEAQSLSSLNSQEELFNQAISDFGKGIGLLPSEAKFGRVTIEVAQSFLADLYMFTNRPDMAKPLLESILLNTTTSFEDVYENIHKNDRNQEVIFAAIFADGDDIASYYPQTFVTCHGGLSDGYFLYTDDLLNHFEFGDFRLDATLQTGDWTSPVTGSVFEEAENEMRNVKLENGNNGDKKGTGDLIFIRYTDIYLYYAETLGDGTGVNGWTALSIVNQVRQRAGLPVLDAVSTDDIIRERRSEFVWEGQRWWDQVRTDNTKGLRKTYDVPEIELIRMGF